MKKALISSIETVEDEVGNVGFRIADISESEYEVHESLFWVDCSDNTNTVDFFYLNDNIVLKSKLPTLIDSNNINQERENRIRVGCNVSLANVGIIYMTGSPTDIRNVAGLGQSAIVRIMTGDETTIDFRDGNNDTFTLSPQQMLELWQKSASYISAIYQVSWDLKEMDPIPVDYTDDVYWPSKDL